MIGEQYTLNDARAVLDHLGVFAEGEERVQALRDHLNRALEVGMDIGRVRQQAEIARLTAENRKLQAVVNLAALLIQPSDDGPQLEGHGSHRNKLMAAARSMKRKAETTTEGVSDV